MSLNINIIFFLFHLFLYYFGLTLRTSLLFAQNAWIQKADFMGGERGYTAGFAIDTSGYIGTGFDGAVNKSDFWEWNHTDNTWSQKADFGGGARSRAIGFSIGTKGYIGMGSGFDLWEWDHANNLWTQKTDSTLALGIRENPVGFSIGTKGYIGTGSMGAIYTNDFWEWEQASNTWSQKADFGGTARCRAVGFSIGLKGFIGTGDEGNETYTSDFWEWDQTANTWNQKVDFGGGARKAAVGFSIGTKGYIGTGWGAGALQDFWEWDPVTETWSQKDDVGGGRWNAIGYSIGTKGYIGTGYGYSSFKQDYWEWNQLCDNFSINITKTDVNCYGGNDGCAIVIPAGGLAPYAFNWSNGETTGSNCNLNAGTYTVTITDSNSCLKSIEVLINTVSMITINDSLVHVTCNNSNDGKIYLSVTGGIPPHTYLWNPPIGTLNNLTAGIYFITVIDSISCMTMDSFLITEPADIVISIDSVRTPFCDSSNGIVYLSAIGGSGTIQYSIDGITYQPDSVFIGLPAGNYTFYARDMNSCIISDFIVISEISSPFISVFSVSNISCHGGNNGSAFIIAGGSIGPYSYSSDNGVTWQLSPNIPGLAAGTYSLVVKDSATGCVSPKSSAIITQPSSLAVNMLSTDETCDYADDGQITARVTGGTPPYFFTWSHSSNSDSVASGLTADDYFVTVADYRLCMISDTGIVNTVGINCLTIPTSFSPNDDGVNDSWIINGLTGYPDATVEVFNRWGSKIFNSGNDYPEPWDGTYGGKHVAAATYYFIMTFGDGKKPVTGTVTVVR